MQIPEVLFLQLTYCFLLFLVMLILFKWSVKKNNKNRYFFIWSRDFQRF